MKSTKSWMAAALVAAFVLGGARVGQALKYSDSTNPHEITMALYFAQGSLGANELGRMADWEGYFQAAADAVWNYTDHQVGIKEVQVYRRSKPATWDVEVKNGPSSEDENWPCASVYSPGRTTHIWLPRDLENVPKRPGVEGRAIAHEMGHSVFGCSDEYLLVCWQETARGKRYLDWNAQEFTEDGDIYDISPYFDSLAGKITGNVADAFGGYIWGPETIMNNDELWEEMSTPNRGGAPWEGTMHYPNWFGGLLLDSGQPYANVHFASYQEFTFHKSAWERMVDTRGLRLGVNGGGAKPEMTWRLMDGSPVVVLVLDSSGSMSGSKWNNALLAAKNAVKTSWLPSQSWEGDRVGAITFESSPVTLFGPTRVESKEDRISLANDIKGYASGGTAINAALQQALRDLRSLGPVATGPECIILLSDGQSQDVVTDATLNALKARGVKVNTVAFGSDADEALLMRIASATAGQYRSVKPTWSTRKSPGAQARALSSTGNLSQFFAELYAEGRESEQTAQLEGVAAGTPVDREIVVDSYGDIDLTVNLYWETGDMDVALVKPDGTVIERVAAEAAESDLDGGKESDSAFIRVSNPEAGTWKVRVVPAAESGEQAYLAMVSCTGRDNMRMYAQASGDSLTWPAPLVVSAYFGGAVPAITGAVVTAVATCPDGTEVPFELNDDGVNGDEEAGDGVYSAEFTQFTEDGEYRFDVEGKNVNGKTSWRGYSPSRGGKLRDPEPVEPFLRRKSLRVQYDGLPEFINATRYTGTEFSSWTLNRNTGAMTGSLVVSNQPSSRKTLIAPFWYAVTETVNVYLAKVDGYTDDGDPYVNITDKVEAALMAKYGRKSMAPGEWVVIDGVEVYSRDRSIPDMTALWSLWADPPAGAERRIDSYDRNANGVLDDEEILLAVEHWEALDMDDEALLKRIELWKRGEE